MPSRSPATSGVAAAFSCLLQRLRAWRRSVIDSPLLRTARSRHRSLPRDTIPRNASRTNCKSERVTVSSRDKSARNYGGFIARRPASGKTCRVVIGRHRPTRGFYAATKRTNRRRMRCSRVSPVSARRESALVDGTTTTTTVRARFIGTLGFLRRLILRVAASRSRFARRTLRSLTARGCSFGHAIRRHFVALTRS